MKKHILAFCTILFASFFFSSVTYAQRSHRRHRDRFYNSDYRYNHGYSYQRMPANWTGGVYASTKLGIADDLTNDVQVYASGSYLINPYFQIGIGAGAETTYSESLYDILACFDTRYYFNPFTKHPVFVNARLGYQFGDRDGYYFNPSLGVMLFYNPSSHGVKGVSLSLGLVFNTHTITEIDDIDFSDDWDDDFFDHNYDDPFFYDSSLTNEFKLNGNGLILTIGLEF